MKPISECKTVAELLESPERWAQGFFAFNQDGDTRSPRSDEACKWCVFGAIKRIYSGSAEDEAFYKLNDIIHESDPRFILMVNWNDDPKRTHAEVLEAVRKAGI
jgi:hypothetical protein